MYKMTPAPVESKLPVINTLDESDSEVSLPLAVTSVVVGGVGDGASRTSKVGSPLRRPKPQEMTRSMPEAPTATRGGMEEDELDEEMAAITMLRCTSLQTEEIAKREREKKERQARRNNRSADYPGLAFGSAMFGSDTTMKLKIIQNELHNIMRSQLRRVEGEVSALSTRVKKFDSDLEQSEKYIKTATAALADAVQWEMDNRKDCQEEEEESNAISQFDAQLRLLEGKLLQAKILASCGEDGELDASHAGSGGREEGQGTSFVAISGVSPEKEAKIELSCAVSFLDV